MPSDTSDLGTQFLSASVREILLAAAEIKDGLMRMEVSAVTPIRQKNAREGTQKNSLDPDLVKRDLQHSKAPSQR